MSQITATGCQKAPTRFLPSGKLTPVLPPMAASTWASKRGGDMGHCHSAVVDGGGKPGHVRHHSPAHANDQVRSRQAEAGKTTAQVLDGAHGLGLFALADEERALLRPGLHLHAHRLLGNDGSSRGSWRHHLAQAVPCAVADQHRVRPVPQVHGYLAHGRSQR